MWSLQTVESKKKKRLWKCEFCQKCGFQNENFRINWGFLPKCVYKGMVSQKSVNGKRSKGRKALFEGCLSRKVVEGILLCYVPKAYKCCKQGGKALFSPALNVSE